MRETGYELLDLEPDISPERAAEIIEWLRVTALEVTGYEYFDDF